VAVLIVGALTVSSAEMKIRKESNKITLPSIDDVPGENWGKLAEKRIFFGHQSVGYNIIDGIGDIISERDHIKLNIVETHEPAEFDRAIFAHSRVGRNTNPVSKIEGFGNIIDAGVGNKVDIAFFKFCYVDIVRDSDPQETLDSYSAAINDLKDRYPKTRFLHVTVPVCSPSKDFKRNIKQSVKLLIGKPSVLDDNIMRQRYNKLLKDAYSKTEPVFDLALTETVDPGGFRCYAAKGAERVSVMAPEYTDDGGHLNGEGRKKVAEQLLIVLAGVASELE
jgi:hypothetical protein